MADIKLILSTEELEHVLTCIEFTEGGLPELAEELHQVREELRYKIRRAADDAGVWDKIRRSGRRGT